MEFTFYKPISDEETIEIEDTRTGTIQKLRRLPVTCRESGKDGEVMSFDCSRRGDILVRNYRPIRARRWTYRQYSPYCVRGKVLTENRKTVIKIYAAYSRQRPIYRLMGTFAIATVCILFILALWLSGILSERISLSGDILLATMYMLIFAMLEYACLLGTKEVATNNLDFQREEVRKRVEAVNRWDE